MSEYTSKMTRIEDALVGQVDEKKLMEFTSEVSKWVRVSGTREEVESLLYCQKEFEAMGYETKLTYHPAFISVPVRAHVELLSPVHMSFRALTHPFTPSTPFCGLKGTLVHESFPNVLGKLVVTEGLPNVDRVRQLEAMGAVGVIYIQDAQLHNSPLSPLWGGPTSKTEGLIPNIPVVSVVRGDGAVIKEQLEKGTVRCHIESVVDTGWRDVPLLEAELPADLSDKFLLYTSHIDSWDYGAMDNGAANATLLECARLLAAERKNWKRGLRMAMWAGHSQGKFFSSSWYADNHFEELEERCIGHVYVDSTGGMDAVVITEAPVMPQTKQLAADVIFKQTGEEFIGKRIGHYADQSFYGIGLTSIFGTFSEQDAEKNKDVLSFKMGATRRAGGLGWWWHTEHDTVDKVDPKLLVRDTKIYAAVLWRLLTAPILPYDFKAAVRDLQNTVESLSGQVGDRFDFSPLSERLSKLEKAVSKFYDGIAGIDEPGAHADEANELLLRLSREIVRVSFHGENHFDFDLSGAMYEIPSLQSALALAKCPKGSYRYHVLKTELLRGCNRVMHHLAAALLLFGR